MTSRECNRCYRGCKNRLPESICGVDVDDLFAYTTTKSIKIRDARLGCLHYFLCFLIFVYILVYQLIAKNGYLRFSPAQNSARLTLQEPTKNCNPNSRTCEDNFTSLSQLSYCCASNSSCKATSGDACSCNFRPSFANYNCTWMDGTAAGVVQQSSIMVTTLLHEYDQTLNAGCFENFPTAGDRCDKLWNVDSDALFFVAEIEKFTVLLDHSVTSATSSIATSSRQMSGMLYVADSTDRQRQLCASRPDAVDSDVNGRTTNTAPCFLPPTKADGLDVIEMDLLLQAMGASLEDSSYSGSGHSVRYEGLTVNLVVEYSNTRPWKGLQPISYVYKPSIIPESAYKSTELQDASQHKRRKLDKHGVLLDVQPGGSLATFDLTQLLLQLTTSLTLLAMSTVGVNILAQYVLRLRHYYSEALYERTTDFDHVNALEAQPDAFINDELERRNLSVRGSKYMRILRLLDYGYRPPEQSPASAGNQLTSAGIMSRPMLHES